MKNMGIAHRKDCFCVLLSAECWKKFFSAPDQCKITSIDIATCWLAGAVCACLVKQAHQTNICLFVNLGVRNAIRSEIAFLGAITFLNARRNAVAFLGAGKAIQGRERWKGRGGGHERPLGSFDVLDKKRQQCVLKKIS